MIRPLHRWPGLLAAVLLAVLSLSGAALSVFPAADRLTAPQAASGLSVAELTSRIQAAHPGVEQIRRAASGRIVAYWFDGGTPGSAVIDPATGAAAAPADPDPVQRWLTGLHRSLFLGDAGRIVVAVGAAAMLVLALSGAALVARRAGGWRRWFGPLKGPLAGRLHVEIARVAVPGLVLSAATALGMFAATFGLIPEGPAPAAPAEVSGTAGMAPAAMALLRDTPISELRELSFPYPGDATDVFTLKTGGGVAWLDQGTGAILMRADPTGWERLVEILVMLHTGQGAASLGLVLGLMVAGVPVLAVTGAVLWLAGRRGRPRLRGQAPAGGADTVILVGSEGGATWAFAATLAQALRAAGQRVHVAPMSAFAPARHARARRIVAMAATWGDGVAPASAAGFLDRLAALSAAPEAPLAVLGFGDRGFPAFCGFAEQVARTAADKGWPMLLPMDRIDRQSPQDFARWGRDFGAAIGLRLDLVHQPVPPRTEALTLVSRREYGEQVQAPAAILRFALPPRGLWRRLTGRGFRFAPGDLLGVLPEGSAVPRLYSLASGSRDGFVEIAVRKHPGGLCSGQLMALRPGDSVRAFLRRNPDFRPRRDRAPLILIGAGTGVGPLAGFIRANVARRPMHLWFGIRHPDSDFLYGTELAQWTGDGRLDSLSTAFSRTGGRVHVQDALRRDAEKLRVLIEEGARIMVCGGRDMAAGVAAALADIMAPAGLTPAMLKAEGRYAEDVY